ncbi:MAG: hypothetical protein SCH71_08460 [Desulfobulbaceae bacterium]|nr:hypothetical protein [Desulfobulbaceae bacterium]
MKNMKDLDKLRVMLPHWIEHNTGHGSEYARWSQLLAAGGLDEIAGLLKKAEGSIMEADAALKEALRKAGGPVNGHGHHHHHKVPE